MIVKLGSYPKPQIRHNFSLSDLLTWQQCLTDTLAITIIHCLTATKAAECRQINDHNHLKPQVPQAWYEVISPPRTRVSLSTWSCLQISIGPEHYNYAITITVTSCPLLWANFTTMGQPSIWCLWSGNICWQRCTNYNWASSFMPAAFQHIQTIERMSRQVAQTIGITRTWHSKSTNNGSCLQGCCWFHSSKNSTRLKLLANCTHMVWAG